MFFKRNDLKLGNSYAVQTGDLAGQIIIYMGNHKIYYDFISVPELLNHRIPKKDFDMGINEGIIEFVERVPRYVRKTAKAKFEENKN